MPIVSIGADYSHARPDEAFFTRHGLTFACRYLLDDARDGGKALKKAEALQLSSWGISICSNFEYSIGGMLRGYTQGMADARIALAELRAIGAPRDVVYFSCDTDVSISQIPLVLDYMRGASAILGKANVGVYGEYDLIEAAHAAGYRWLWQCYAWSRGLWSAHATVRQVHNGAFPGEYDADLNHAMTADIGQWTLGDDMSTPQEIAAAVWAFHLPRPDAFDDGVGHSAYEALVGAVNGSQRAARTLTKVNAVYDEVDGAEEALTRVEGLIGALAGGDPQVIAAKVAELLNANLPAATAAATVDLIARRVAGTE